MSDRRPVSFLFAKHGLSWLRSRHSEDPSQTLSSNKATIESIAQIDGLVSYHAGEEHSQRPQRLSSIKNVLEVHLEVLQWWSGLIAGFSALVASFVALLAIMYGRSPLHGGFIALLALAIASLGFLAKALIERRRTWIALNLLAVKRLQGSASLSVDSLVQR